MVSVEAAAMQLNGTVTSTGRTLQVQIKKANA